jgi:hypothetical protein
MCQLCAAVYYRVIYGTYQTINEVYSTIPAITMVRIRPGKRPRTEYDQGNDMIARQMYSEKSRAAV